MNTISPANSTLWWLYFLRCRNGLIYTGISPDPTRRFLQHQHGRSQYTRRHRPLELIGAFPVGSQKEALREERLVKRMLHAEKLALACISRSQPSWTLFGDLKKTTLEHE